MSNIKFALVINTILSTLVNNEVKVKEFENPLQLLEWVKAHNAKKDRKMTLKAFTVVWERSQAQEWWNMAREVGTFIETIEASKLDKQPLKKELVTATMQFLKQDEEKPEEKPKRKSRAKKAKKEDPAFAQPVYTVYHNQDPSALLFDRLQEMGYVLRENLHKVAMVRATKLGQVFELTNHIEGSWTQNPEILGLQTNTPWGINPRSTSVGDVILDPQGKAWIVAPMGFKELENFSF
jgi:hypothetical protein